MTWDGLDRCNFLFYVCLKGNFLFNFDSITLFFHLQKPITVYMNSSCSHVWEINLKTKTPWLVCDCYFGFPPFCKRANNVLQRWHVLAFYMIGPFLKNHLIHVHLFFPTEWNISNWKGFKFSRQNIMISTWKLWLSGKRFQ